MLEAVYQTTWRYIQEDNNINIHVHEHFKSHILAIVSIVIEHCHNYRSILKPCQLICM
jgi:hypothetical protein